MAAVALLIGLGAAAAVTQLAWSSMPDLAGMIALRTEQNKNVPTDVTLPANPPRANNDRLPPGRMLMTFPHVPINVNVDTPNKAIAGWNPDVVMPKGFGRVYQQRLAMAMGTKTMGSGPRWMLDPNLKINDHFSGPQLPFRAVHFHSHDPTCSVLPAPSASPDGSRFPTPWQMKPGRQHGYLQPPGVRPASLQLPSRTQVS